jgi:hypothetical protein
VFRIRSRMPLHRPASAYALLRDEDSNIDRHGRPEVVPSRRRHRNGRNGRTGRQRETREGTASSSHHAASSRPRPKSHSPEGTPASTRRGVFIEAVVVGRTAPAEPTTARVAGSADAISGSRTRAIVGPSKFTLYNLQFTKRLSRIAKPPGVLTSFL